MGRGGAVAIVGSRGEFQRLGESQMQATAAIQHSTEPEWFASWFDSAHYQRLYAHRDQAEANAFVDRVTAHLAARDGASILDLGCGNGRHSRRLAARGFHVTGLDLSAQSLELARRRRGADIRWVRQDMRQPFGTDAFEYVFSLFTSFGYFESPADHLTVVNNIARSLTSGGRVVIDYLNVHQAEAHLVREETTRRDGVVYRISRWSDTDAIFKRIIVRDRYRQPLQFVERVAKLTLNDFRFMFALSGLRLDATYGDYSLNAFRRASSPRLILVASKTAADSKLPAGQLLADAAQCLRGHAEVRREHQLGDAERNGRVNPQELQVALLGGAGQ